MLKVAKGCKPLLKPFASFEALSAYSVSDEHFAGTPPRISEQAKVYAEPIRAAALASVASIALYVQTLKTLLTKGSLPAGQQSLKNMAVAMEEQLGHLTAAARRAKTSGVLKV